VELRRTLDSLWSTQPTGRTIPVFVSQDGDHAGVSDVIRTYPRPITHLTFLFQEIITNDPLYKPHKTYFKIAQHYRIALDKVFDKGFDRVIIIEDDMEFAPDFFSYFEAVAPIVESDSSLLCASAWNDNGQRRRVQDPGQLYRSECFPGLGWLMTRGLWDELQPKWPEGFWDDWLREGAQRKGRACIFPEVNRAYTFGEKGSSGGQFFNRYLKQVRLNDVPVDFSAVDLTYISSEARYDAYVRSLIAQASPSSSIDQVPSVFRALPSSPSPSPVPLLSSSSGSSVGEGKAAKEELGRAVVLRYAGLQQLTKLLGN